MSCIRDSKVCTKCCDVVHVHKIVLKYDKCDYGDVAFIQTNWKRMSVRLAKKRNPYMFSKSAHGKQKVSLCKKNMTFFKCTNLTDKGCGIYTDRPEVCRGFPNYAMSIEDYHEIKSSNVADYTRGCTVHYNIPIKFIAT
jgi:Fe-S-cluster containining protein